jgi:hypothetical protein
MLILNVLEGDSREKQQNMHSQSISAGYYPNKSQFMGEPMGKGGVSLMYRKSFD